MRRHAHLTVIGDDKAGVIARICQSLFECGGNIEELDQHVTHGLFTMHLEVSWPASGHTEREMREGLGRIGSELGMDVEFRPAGGAVEGPARIGLLVSKESHAPRAVLEACGSGAVDAEVAVIVGNRPHLAALAEASGVPFHHVDDGDKPAHEAAVLAILKEADVDLVVLARYMRILSPNFVWRWPNRILNIHPSLLPSFPGAMPYRQAWQRGVRVAGVTAHLVTVDLDQGPIVAQRAFDIDPGAPLKDLVHRGQALESEVLVEGIGTWLSGKLKVGWGRTWVEAD